ncbi:MAG: NAD(P)-binding domain-containing protein [Geminicoccaceae bacterium]
MVVGGGQAGIAMSEHLGKSGVPHLVVERGRIAERWRSWRWDSLVANGPAWHDRFPGLEFTNVDADGFAGKEAVADYFADYARMIEAPVRCGVEVLLVRPIEGRPGFLARTSAGDIEAERIVAATGPFQKPVMPPIVPADAGIDQLHSVDYRNPQQLREGGVLVVGGGSSGTQIADELQRAGRSVHLAVGPHHRLPRRYRERDYCWWFGVLGIWDAPSMEAGSEHVTIAVSGAYGGRTIDFRKLSESGITLVGKAARFADGVLHFAPGLTEDIARGDAHYLSLLDRADAHVERNGLDLPAEPEARIIGPDPDCLRNPVMELDLKEAGVSTIIWATGFEYDFGWLQVDAFDAEGRPSQRRGISTEPGVYFLGLPWMTRWGSSFIWGVWHDARHIAEHIATQRGYRDYRPSNEPA